MMHLSLLLVHSKASCPIPYDEQSSVLGELLELLGCEACAIGGVDEEESSLAKKAICLSFLASSMT